MQRRDFIRKAAVGATAGGVLLSGCGDGAESGAPNVQTKPTIRWRLASSFTKSVDVLYGTVEQMAERVSQLTDGRFTIRPYQGGEIVPALEVLEAVQQGSVEIGHSASYYYVGKNPALAFDCTVPFGLTSRQQNAWLYDGGGLELMRELFADFNIVNFPGGNTGVQMGGWFREPVANLSELKGLKMRIPGLGGEVMSRLGVTVQVLAGGDVYVALERGAIDAAEWVGPYDDEKLGLHEVAKNYYYPGWWEPGASVSFYVNRKKWEELPSAYQEALAVAFAEANISLQSRYDARNMEALGRLRKEGVQFRPFSDDIMEAARRESTAIMDEYAAADASYAKVYTAFREWREQAFDWFGMAERSYADFAFGKGSASGV